MFTFAMFLIFLFQLVAKAMQVGIFHLVFTVYFISVNNSFFS